MNKSLNKIVAISFASFLLVGCSSSSSNSASNTSETSTNEPTGQIYDSTGNAAEDESSAVSKEDATIVESDTDEKVRISAEGPSIENIEVTDVYPGSAEGKNGSVYVEVEYADGKITNVEVSSHSEDEDRDAVSEALTKVPEEIVSANSTDVDAVSGATETSNAIMEAVAAAIERAE